MTILLTSAGRRTQLTKYFRDNFNKVVTADCSSVAPALYETAEGYIVPRINNNNYLDILIDICKKEQLKGIISLIDPELSLLAYEKDKLKDHDILPIVSDYHVTEICFDKLEMYNFLKENSYYCANTYSNLEDFKQDYQEGKVSLPVFIKPQKGSASIGINQVNNFEDLQVLMNKREDLIIQEYLNGEEYGIDVYVDLISKGIVSIFAKKKVKMRAGETDKAVSIKDDKLFELVEDFIYKLGVIGPIDIDIFKIDGEYYISEVNPRFSGGYLLAYECGENYPLYIKNNLEGIKNHRSVGNYQEGIYMMKHDTISIKKESELIK
ncbi:ATP-grasp domain-containing protein [Natranaerobius thermophilus]|uniref:ATP-grasp domain-containing protein n=1 Tax=Natranaerobius thermophilus (strain ATCC BAA-1301 / DSM 18059 / JW/NM-WN-LF) TaxID=457570 RepID=B2A1E5_NATTJ|nr:ATP-grasp domain-containing protein [Natranaerobius thermophilus]ACB86083.1 protein of unknown function DUF201 [Natranaerobius thermophilus JW/NM-WN-LF]